MRHLWSSRYYLPALFILLGAVAFPAWRYYESLGQAHIPDPLSFYTSPFSATSNASRRAYATALYPTSSYLPGALLLGWSLHQHAMLAADVAQHMELLYTPGTLDEREKTWLGEVGWDMREVELIKPPESRKPAKNFQEQYTKLRLFEMEEFDQIFYLDADMLVVRPFPEIWSFPVPLAAARDVRKGFGWLPTINAGTLLLKPNRKLVEHMMEIAPTLRYNAVFAEQGLLQAYWAQAITHLPYVYNGQLGIKRVFPKIWQTVFQNDVKIIHYTGLKPWQWHEEPDMPVERCVWWEMWEKMLDWRRENGLSDLSDMASKPA
ncbi:nucleotide-diphospho-sugar transferase [Dacryopinax primogenitus]|uniref:Nucleotide-diphospho-sugar transferase n=1 Tax=Dacryopinax primogenitus (strain DJM 731) TaxID=1858805 RepID=M5GB72_DACPD|nr:nucleotide-diphospho-sugar transferase [Dacryopinax primogenitus]EJU03272.1 nucleotide-diphospho-sugar transferase [Dacryopinax primogenitus]